MIAHPRTIGFPPAGDGRAAQAILPWLRRGAAALIASVGLPPDPETTSAIPSWTGPRVILKATVGFNGDTLQESIDLSLAGTGEITGFDANAVIRTWPQNHVGDAEPGFLALVEFDQPDLPWRYTPVRANFSDRLDPWLVLLVVEAEEIIEYHPPDGRRPLARVKVRNYALPNLSQSWAWAHVHVNGHTSVTAAEALYLCESVPEAIYSRLLSPRPLEPRKAYRAFLVPAFERGRRAGLDEPVDIERPGAGASQTDASLLAWKAPRASDQAPVELPVYYEWQFQTAAAASDFESLVRRMSAEPLPATVGTRTVDASAPETGLPPASTTPLRIEGALRNPAVPEPPWDDSERVPFVTALTDLLDAPKAALHGSGLARFAPPLYGRWLAAYDAVGEPGTPPWLDRLNRDPRLRMAAGAGSAVVTQHEEKLLAGAWQQVDGIAEINDKLRLAQLARALGERLREHLGAMSLDAFLFLTAPVFARVRQGTVTIASLVTVSAIGHGPFEPAFRRLLARFGGPAPTLLQRMNASALVPAPWPPLPSFVAAIDAESADALNAVPPRPTFTLLPEIGPLHHPPALVPDEGSGGTDSADAAAFRGALAKVLGAIHAPAITEPALLLLDLDGIRATLTTVLDPVDAVTTGITRRLSLPSDFVRDAADPLEPILYSPEFSQPMFEPLRELSPEWILPSLGNVPANSISLALVNQRFIEAYLAGLSHELARSLLAHDYPTDQRGTHFRQFWAPRGYTGLLGSEQLRDIRSIAAWSPSNDLGANSVRPMPPEPLVLLLRGDLLRQYPTAVVYAARAHDAGGKPEPGFEEKHPLFRGTLGGDIAFFGFELTAAEARGDGTPPDEGWFFLLQEQPSEPRFGPTAAPYNELFLRPDEPAGDTSASIASTLQHRPVRVAIHASQMLGGL